MKLEQALQEYPEYRAAYRHSPKQFYPSRFQIKFEGGRYVIVGVPKQHIGKRYRIVGVLKKRRRKK
jgi:hypothetical protein